MTKLATQAESEPQAQMERELPRLFGQGEDGLFHQSWYPICLSSEVERGAVIGRDFLDGKVVVFRGEDGVVSVTSAFCPHLGANLACGTVVGNSVQCAFHRWEFDRSGACVRTGVGDPAPRVAKLFAFPTCERYGIVWVFNGTEPLWPLPGFDRPDSELVFHCYSMPLYTCDGWTISCNTPDMQHIKVVHGFNFHGADPHDLVEWQQWSHSYPLKASFGENTTVDWRIGIHGTSIYQQQGTVDDWWLGIIVGMSSPRPGHSVPFGCIAVEKGDGSDARNRLNMERAQWAEAYGRRIAAEDADILNTIRFRPGTLTRADRTLAQFFRFLRNYPRAHPSASFIR